MNNEGFKFVEFHECNTCKYFKTDESDDPCHDCLNNPVNTYSNKPLHYEKDEQLED